MLIAQARSLDETMIRSLDMDGDAKLHKSEFALGMLLKLELVDRADIQPFFDRFDELDTDGSGEINAEDLAHHWNESAQHEQAVEQEEGVFDPVYQACGWLTLCAGYACLNFLWNTLYGLSFLATGVLQALTIGYTMSYPLTQGRLSTCMALAALTVAGWGLTTWLWVGWVHQPPCKYFDLDPLAACLPPPPHPNNLNPGLHGI